VVTLPAAEGVARLAAVLGKPIKEWRLLEDAAAPSGEPIEVETPQPGIVEDVPVVDAPFFPPGRRGCRGWTSYRPCRSRSARGCGAARMRPCRATCSCRV
jgi:hypothetical protein